MCRTATSVALIAALGLGSGCAFIEDFNFGAEAQIWQAVDISASVTENKNRNDSDKVDLIGEVGLEDAPTIFAGQVFLQFGRTIYHIDLWSHSDSGTVTFNNKTINGQTFTGLTNVDISVQMLRFGVQQTLLDHEGFYLGFLVGLDALMTSFKFKDAATGAPSVTSEPFVPAPILGGYLEIGLPQIPKLKIFGDAMITFIDALNQDEIKGSLVDVRLGARYQLSPNVFLAAGYRIFDADFDLDSGSGGDNDHVEFAANGVTFYATVRF